MAFKFHFDVVNKMNLRFPPRNYAISAKRSDSHSTHISYTTQVLSDAKAGTEVSISKLLDRKWTLPKPDTQIHQISLSETQFSNNTSPSLGEGLMEKNGQQPSFYVVRDDLLHPLANGNKARKLDALLPLIEDHAATDVVTCGGCQSAHTAALAVLCAERGVRSHLLLRGERPAVSTGYNMISALYGNVTYVPRSIYAKREEMLEKHARVVAGSSGSVLSLSSIPEAKSGSSQRLDPRGNPKRVVIVNEGAGDAAALLGVIRLVQYLSQNHIFGKSQPLKLLVDSGTGTTAIGLGIGAKCFGLPWEIHAVMLADCVDGYRRQEQKLVSEFLRLYDFPSVDQALNNGDCELVRWLERSKPRKFGNVLAGEVKECQNIAQQTGILVDPIYTLAAWQLAAEMSKEEAAGGGGRIVMLHTGGTLGMFGLAQRYKSFFDVL